MVKRDAAALAIARDQLCDLLGPAGLVDAAATVSSFQRMTRIADATGIPLDPPVNALSAEIQEDLGLREFKSASTSSTPGVLVAFFAKLFRPLLFRLARRTMKRRKV